MSSLTPEKALIFRITHRDNVPWILAHGMACRNSPNQNPTQENIGNPELILKRSRHPVCINGATGGTLNDYVPFYFTPYSPMLLNIKTGYGGVTKRSNDEIVIFVSSLPKLKELEVPFVFTDRHAYVREAEFFDDMVRLDRIDWPLLQSRNFKRDPNDPGKQERYQAEALVRGQVPVDAFFGIVCHDDATKASLNAQVASRRLELQVHKLPGWYFQ